MKVYRDAWQREDLPQRGVVTIGNFDGLHLGQQALIGRARDHAGREDADCVVVTFEPHPLRILAPERAPLRLTTANQKRRLLEAAGATALAVVDFSAEFAQTTAEAFVREFLVGRLASRSVYVGATFSFGRGREGSLAFLEQEGERLGFEVHGVAEVVHDGRSISSTRIRRCVAEGDVEGAKAMLGRAFRVEGRVERGAERGRELGWPTANLAVENDLFPGDGVYASEVRLAGEAESRPSVTNVGTRPTFDGPATRNIETHLLDFDEDLYGRHIELSFCSRLRAERRFASVEQLVRQIERDALAAREYFSACAC